MRTGPFLLLSSSVARCGVPRQTRRTVDSTQCLWLFFSLLGKYLGATSSLLTAVCHMPFTFCTVFKNYLLLCVCVCIHAILSVFVSTPVLAPVWSLKDNLKESALPPPEFQWARWQVPSPTGPSCWPHSPHFIIAPHNSWNCWLLGRIRDWQSFCWFVRLFFV